MGHLHQLKQRPQRKLESTRLQWLKKTVRVRLKTSITSGQYILEMFSSFHKREAKFWVMYGFVLSFKLHQMIVSSCFSPQWVPTGVGVRLFTPSKHLQAEEMLYHGYTLWVPYFLCWSQATCWVILTRGRQQQCIQTTLSCPKRSAPMRTRATPLQLIWAPREGRAEGGKLRDAGLELPPPQAKTKVRKNKQSGLSRTIQPKTQKNSWK